MRVSKLKGVHTHIQTHRKHTANACTANAPQRHVTHPKAQERRTAQRKSITHLCSTAVRSARRITDVSLLTLPTGLATATGVRASKGNPRPVTGLSVSNRLWLDTLLPIVERPPAPCMSCGVASPTDEVHPVADKRRTDLLVPRGVLRSGCCGGGGMVSRTVRRAREASTQWLAMPSFALLVMRLRVMAHNPVVRTTSPYLLVGVVLCCVGWGTVEWGGEL
jgi:hypothetical protein